MKASLVLALLILSACASEPMLQSHSSSYQPTAEEQAIADAYTPPPAPVEQPKASHRFLKAAALILGGAGRGLQQGSQTQNINCNSQVMGTSVYTYCR